MKIELHEMAIRDIAENYVDNNEEGVIGYNGKLNIRPKYQREFVYDEKKRNAVIDTIMKGFPLNVMYWVKNDDGTFEMQQILDYQCMIYFCEGNDKEKLDWFKIINIAGERLTDQELRNAVYTGTWLTSAKSIFSKTQCAAYNLSNKYVTGSPIRQEILQIAISWKNKGNIEEYMSIHQHDPNANELWTYFQNVINWVMLTFPEYRKEMKGIDWGKLYDIYGSNLYDTNELEKRIAHLMMDDDVTNKKGIYEFVLSGEERCLNIRAFTESQKRRMYEYQKGICKMCHEHFEYEKMQGDHITPWSKGGKTVDDNLQMLCEDCNRKKLNM